MASSARKRSMGPSQPPSKRAGGLLARMELHLIPGYTFAQPNGRTSFSQNIDN